MPLLVTALGDEVTPAAACLLPGVSEDGIALFGQAVPGLLPPARGPALTALRAVGVRTLSFAEASAALSGIDREPDFWWQIYDALATADRVPDPEDLADIPVPLAGGRRSLGARNCLLPAPAALPIRSPPVGGWDVPTRRPTALGRTARGPTALTDGWSSRHGPTPRPGRGRPGHQGGAGDPAACGSSTRRPPTRCSSGSVPGRRTRTRCCRTRRRPPRSPSCAASWTTPTPIPPSSTSWRMSCWTWSPPAAAASSRRWPTWY